MKHRYLAIWLTNCTWHCLYCRCFSWHPFYSQELQHCVAFFVFSETKKVTGYSFRDSFALACKVKKNNQQKVFRNFLLVFFIFYFVARDGCHFKLSVKSIVCFVCTLKYAMVQDPCRMGVWLGWHICQNATQVSQGQLRENRNLSLSIRAKAVLIYVLSVPVHNVKILAIFISVNFACYV